MTRKTDENNRFRTFLPETESGMPGIQTVFDCFPLEGVAECSVPFPDLCLGNKAIRLIEKGVVYSDKAGACVPYFLAEHTKGKG